MWMVYFDSEIVLDERHVKAFAVVCNDERVSLYILFKIIQVLILYIMIYLLSVIDNDCRDRISIPQPGGFNVKIRNRVAKVRKHSPVLIRFQRLCKIDRVLFFQV